MATLRALSSKTVLSSQARRRTVVCQAKLGKNASAGIASVVAAAMLAAPPAFSQIEVSAAASQSYQQEMQALIESRTGKDLPEVEVPVQVLESAPVILTDDENFGVPAHQTRQEMLAAVRAEAEQEAGVARSSAAPAASPAVLAGAGVLAVVGLAAAGLQNGQQEEEQQEQANAAAAAANAASAVPPPATSELKQPEPGTGPVAMA